jgi:hypothetical protein
MVIHVSAKKGGNVKLAEEAGKKLEKEKKDNEKYLFFTSEKEK